MDKREIRTKKAVKTAFEKLIKENKYSEITIQMILNTAEIGRATFYDHYKSKDEVLKVIVEDIFLHIQNPEKEELHDFSGDTEYIYELMHMLHHFEEEKELLNSILKSEGQQVFLNSLKKHLYLETKRNIMPYYCNPSIPDPLLLNHLSTSLMELILWWICKDGCIETPEAIAYYYFYLVMPSLNARKEVE